MSVAIDRTARGVVIWHGIAGAFVGALPAAIASMVVEKPGTNPWFRDLLLWGSMAGSVIGMIGALAGMFHEDLRAIRRSRERSNSGEPHMDRALLPAQPRGGSSDSHPVPPQFRTSQLEDSDPLLVGADLGQHP